MPLQGGIPIEHDGDVIGAIGVSGASSADEDHELARDRREAVQRPSAQRPRRVFFPAAAVAEVRGGRPAARRPRYKIDAGRRGPGEVEYHEHVVDVMHVVEGRHRRHRRRDADPRGPRRLAPAVEGGTHELPRATSRDPDGVPHQFVDVSDPFLYFVVKVEAA